MLRGHTRTLDIILLTTYSMKNNQKRKSSISIKSVSNKERLLIEGTINGFRNKSIKEISKVLNIETVLILDILSKHSVKKSDAEFLSINDHGILKDFFTSIIKSKERKKKSAPIVREVDAAKRKKIKKYKRASRKKKSKGKDSAYDVIENFRIRKSISTNM
jgi:hypothetical protein